MSELLVPGALMLIVWLFILASVGMTTYVLAGLGKRLFKRNQD